MIRLSLVSLARQRWRISRRAEVLQIIHRKEGKNYRCPHSINRGGFFRRSRHQFANRLRKKRLRRYSNVPVDDPLHGGAITRTASPMATRPATTELLSESSGLVIQRRFTTRLSKEPSGPIRNDPDFQQRLAGTEPLPKSPNVTNLEFHP